MSFRKPNKHKKPKVTFNTVAFRFFNGGVQYVCVITAPVDIPKYRLKEVFDRTFVGLKSTQISILQSYTNFKSLHRDVSFEIKTAKEYEECLKNK